MWPLNPTGQYAPSTSNLFASFFLGGFECSTHRLKSGRRLDLVASTQHDRLAEKDYLLLAEHGIRSVREGLRWHLIEAAPDRFDFESLKPILHAAISTGTEVLWDLWHYGWPDHLDIFSDAFVTHFAAYARAAAEILSADCARPFVCPVNEISFFSWAGGEAGVFNPFAHKQGDAVKRQLVRASIAAIQAMREVNSEIRFLHIDPLINVSPEQPELAAAAQSYHLSQFEAGDMLLGRRCPRSWGDTRISSTLWV